MVCERCGKTEVIRLQQGGLCSSCFQRYFERKVYSTIRKHGLFTKHDRLCVACSGGKDSVAALHLVNKLAKKRRQDVFALSVDEGIDGYRDRQIDDMRSFCDANGIGYAVVSFREEYGHDIGELMEIARNKGMQTSRCALCGVLRRSILNRHAKRLGATRIIAGHNMDDEAQTVLMNLFKGGIELAARMGPSTGAVRHSGFVPRVKPLYYCLEKETEAYAKLMGFRVLYDRCPYRESSYRAYVAGKLDEIEDEHAGTKASIISNLMKILPLLKSHYSVGSIPECSSCGEPSKNPVCLTCRTLRDMGIRNAD